MESDAKALFAEADQRRRGRVDEAAQGVASGARALFTSLVFGLIGAWLGTRHNRVLRPQETQIAPPPKRPTRTASTMIPSRPASRSF